MFKKLKVSSAMTTNDVLSTMQHIKSTKQSLPDQVAMQINQLIIDRRLEIGEKIPNEYELAQQLNVGRSTVREAIKLLVARNVLEIQRGKGTFIANNTGMIDDPFGFAYIEDEERLVRELFAIRMNMEPWIASLAAQNATEENIAELRGMQEEVEKLIQSGKDHLPMDQQFHIYLANCTQNRVLPMLVPAITYSVHLFGKMNHHSLGEETILTHAKIVEAIAAHDPEAAREAMIDHLEVNRRSVAVLNEER